MDCNTNDFRMWCQAVLPLVYDDSLSYYEQLCKFAEYFNITAQELEEIVEQVDKNTLDITSANDKSNEAMRIAWLAYNIAQKFDVDKAYVDKQDELTLNSAKSFAEAQDKVTLDSAKEYADLASIKGIAFATCYDEAAPDKTKTNTWYVPKTMPKPNGEVGLMVDVFWKNGRVDGLGYNIQLIWGEPGGADNEIIVDTASSTDKLTGSYSIPTEGTVRYVLTEVSGKKHWDYVSGELIPTQFSTNTEADVAEKVVPGLSLEYLPGMEIYVQMDKGNTAELMSLKDDNGVSLPVYGNGTGAKTGAIPAGYILHLVNSGDHWQIVNGAADNGIVTIDIETRGVDSFWTLPLTTAQEIIDMVNANKEVRLHFYDTITNTGDQLYTYETTVKGVPTFRRNIITADKASRINIGVQWNGEVKFEEIPYKPLVDPKLSDTSKNPVENQAVTKALEETISVNPQELTEEQKKQARENIGASEIYGIWENINEHITSEPTRKIIILEDSNGNRFSLKAVRISLDVPTRPAADDTLLAATTNDGDIGLARAYVYGASSLYLVLYGDCFNDKWVSAFSWDTKAGAYPAGLGKYDKTKLVNYIECSSSLDLPAGTKIVVEGVRA